MENNFMVKVLIFPDKCIIQPNIPHRSVSAWLLAKML